MIPVLLFPNFDPVIVQIGPFGIRWYALAYIFGIVLGWRLTRRLVQLPPVIATSLQVDDFLTWATLGIVLGGRLGYVLFYQPGVYLAHPARIFEVWQGGMSFHGGAIGMAIAITWFCRRNGIRLLAFADRIAVCVPIGLGLGRVANFINGELWGRPAPLWWPGAMVFPYAEPVANPSQQVVETLRQTVCAGFDPSRCVPRFPSQIYEAALEGLLLFTVMFTLSRREMLRERTGFLTGAFLVGYGVARITGEFFREPDAFLGFLPFGTTMGQVLCVPMLIAGAWLIARAR
ncbi:MAG TPA: prolipoprotein diacylglyceryl transferase [Acetobacteraceae bacterium]|jgi:phosphatidylglycerol:prolipoprotein diacylglycerol transferase|nr:prolipoprotein diacylglyceryl transferase [Acetobacteraceae bacterium]